MGPGILLGLVCGCGGVLLAALVAGSLLRLAVSITNKMVSPARAPASGGIAEWDWDDWDDEYTAPARPRRKTGGIPEPGLVKCMLIVFLSALVYGLAFVLLGFASEELLNLRLRGDAQLVIGLFALPVGALALAVLLCAMLPTSIWRGALVAFVYTFIFIGIGLGLGAVFFVMGIVLG
jgi:hypothetical protein